MIKKHTFKKHERSDHLNISCHFWQGNTLLRHCHEDYYEIIILTKGEAESIIGKSCITQRRKDVSIVRPMITHGVEGDAVSEHFNIAVSCDRFERLMAGKDAVKNALSRSDYVTVSLNDTEFGYISECISMIDEECSTPFSVSLAETVLSVIFLSIMKAEAPESISEYNIGYYCKDAMVKIEKGSVTFKSASDIYALYPVSHTSFIEEFKRLTGKTPSEYLRQAKLTRAKELLINSSRSVLDIAYEVGYDSMSHFIKCFKARYGETPLKYRKTQNAHETDDVNE